MNNQKICPLMSKGENIVYCNENCAWKIDAGYTTKCAVTQIVEAIDVNSEQVNNIFLAMPEN